MHVFFRVPPGKRAEFLAILDEMRPLVSAEDGTFEFAWHVADDDPDVVWLYETYRDEDAIAEHRRGTGHIVKRLVELAGPCAEIVGPAVWRKAPGS
jgi:quinol monooxygenase YgiN